LISIRKLLVSSPKKKKKKKKKKECYKLMDDIKFSHVIIKELFRNTSWGNVDTPFNYDFMTMKLKSHS